MTILLLLPLLFAQPPDTLLRIPATIIVGTEAVAEVEIYQISEKPDSTGLLIFVTPPPDPPVWPTSNFDQGVPRGEWRDGRGVTR